MAKASWLNVQPQQGSGNGSVKVSTDIEHSGREARETLITFKAPNVPDVERKVIQAGRPEFVTIPSSMSISKDGGTLSINGTSNAASLTFSKGDGGTLNFTIPSVYNANTKNTENGSEILGDPGKSVMYPYRISITVPANDSFTEKTGQLLVKPTVGRAQICTLTLAADSPYLTVAEGNINLSYTGEAVSVAVSSNTDWSVE